MLPDRAMKDRSSDDDVSECVAACFGCSLVCTKCSDSMLGMDVHSGNPDVMNRCIRLCRDCADFCTLTARWISRVSPYSNQICRLCADICELCAACCEQYVPYHALCGVCANECRRCAELCRQVAVSATA